MATEDLSLFDRGPEMVQQALQQQEQQKYMQQAQLGQGGGQRLLAAQAGGMLGGLLNPRSSPEVENAKKAMMVKKELDATGLDPNDPNYYKTAAKLLQKVGLTSQAIRAANAAADLELKQSRINKMDSDGTPAGGTAHPLQKLIDFEATLPEGHPFKQKVKQAILEYQNTTKTKDLANLEGRGVDPNVAMDSVYGKVVPIPEGGGLGVVGPSTLSGQQPRGQAPQPQAPAGAFPSVSPQEQYQRDLKALQLIEAEAQANPNDPYLQKDLQNTRAKLAKGVPGEVAPPIVPGIPPQENPGGVKMLIKPKDIGQKELEKSVGKEFAERLNDIPKLMNEQNQLQSFAEFAKNVDSGTGQQTWLKAKKLLLALPGVGDSEFGRKISRSSSDQEMFKSISGEITVLLKNIDGKNQLPGNFSDRDLQFLQDMAPTLSTTPKGVQKIVGWMAKRKQLSIDYNKQLQQKPDGVSVLEWKKHIDSTFYQKPLFPKVIAKTNKEVDALPIGEQFADEQGNIFEKTGPNKLKRIE